MPPVFRPLLVLAVLAAPALAAPDDPQIAVWDPQAGTTETRFRLDPAELNTAAERLRAGGADVERVTTAQINQPDVFSAARFDALVLPGETFPAANIQALKTFADAGGVLIALRTHVPFLIAIEPETDGRWTMAPKTPTFAWQRTDIMQLFGLKYTFKPELHDSGLTHEPSPLLKRYLPSAVPLNRKLPGLWIYPTGDAEMYPLLRSKRIDGADVTPQIYIARKGKDTALVVGDGYANSGIEGFPKPEQVLPALAKLASDLKRGRVQLDPATKLVALDKLPIPLPLQNRAATSNLEPKGVKALVNWGRFNGSSLDLAPAGTANSLTNVLAPGASLELPLANFKFPADKPVFLRVRGAFNATGAGMKLTLQSGTGQRVLWNELFNYIDSRSAGNFNGGLAGLATEFTRILFVPAEAAPRSLTVSNPGTQPIYFDALDLEIQTAPAPERIIGLGQGALSIPREISTAWTNVRANPRPQFIGPPGEPKRWDRFEANINAAVRSNSRVQLVLEGTPDWAAISPERMALGKQANRPHTVPPDPQKFAALVEEIVQRYGDKIDSYEVWNEPDIQQFWRGTGAEYITMYNLVVPIVRRLDPTATVITAGMSGFKDSWVNEMVEAGVPAKADLFAFHPYAGKSSGWDTVYGLVQGSMLSHGQDIEIYCDESGFVSRNSEWFQPPPEFTPATQARQLDTAMARLLATDLAKLNVFNAGGDGNAYGLFDARGQAMPAYQVFADYLPLGQNGARRTSVGLTSQDGSPLQGVYTAASSHADGSVTVVVNPVEAEALQPLENPSTEFDKTAGWTTFFGKTQVENGTATVTSDAGKAYAGFYTHISLDVARLPLLEINVPRSDGGYDLVFKLPDGKQIPAATKQGAGVWRGDLRQLLPAGTKEFELSFRVYGPTAFDSVRFSSAGTAVRPEPALPVRLSIPLPNGQNYSATLKRGDNQTPLAIQSFKAGNTAWAEVMLDLKARSVLTLRPAP